MTPGNQVFIDVKKSYYVYKKEYINRGVGAWCLEWKVQRPCPDLSGSSALLGRGAPIAWTPQSQWHETFEFINNYPYAMLLSKIMSTIYQAV